MHRDCALGSEPALNVTLSNRSSYSMPAKRKTYTRDDGVVMVEISPNLFVEESIAERLGLSR